MKLAEKLLEGYIQRLSQEEKEALFTRIVEHFFREMTPEQKQRLVEQAITRLLEGIDMQEFLPRLLAILWKNTDSEEIRKSFLDKMSKMASTTSEKIAEMIPARFKKPR
ncbi:MAG: hypothetical protein RBT80_00175 [Candidatus Vecturithrix sp.]|jgi:uncharacterized membrane-anchored protein YjiN (DUF445 family)|nr:hypothetical protein [Candidatus Vecturithrix sp.]